MSHAQRDLASTKPTPDAKSSPDAALNEVLFHIPIPVEDLRRQYGTDEEEDVEHKEIRSE